MRLPSRYSLFCVLLGLGWYGVLVISRKALRPFHKSLGLDDFEASHEMLADEPVLMAFSFAFAGWFVGLVARKQITSWEKPPGYWFSFALASLAGLVSGTVFGVLWYSIESVQSGEPEALFGLPQLLPYTVIFAATAVVLHLPTVLAFCSPWMKALRWAAG